MALQVWITGIDGMKNLGLGGTRNLGSSTSNANGKIGTCQKIITNYNSNCTLNPNTTDITMCGWFKFNLAELQTTLNNSGYNSSKTTPTGNLLGQHNYGGLALCYSTNNQYNASGTINAISVFGAFRDSNSSSSCSSLNIPFDTWTHIVLTWNHTTKTLTLYINGVSKATSTNAAITNITTWNFQINTGYVWGGNGPGKSIPLYFNDIRCYDNLLSEDEIHELSLGKVGHLKLNDYEISRSGLTSVTWNLLVKNGNFANGYTDWTTPNNATITVDSNKVVTITKTNGTGMGALFASNVTSVNTSHKYYISALLATGTISAAFGFHASEGTVSSNTVLYSDSTILKKYSAVIQPIRTTDILFVRCGASTTANGSTCKCANIICIDLTQMFGSGNEPTAAQFEEMFPLHYYPYDTGTVKDLRLPIPDISGYHHNLTAYGAAISLVSNSPRYDKCVSLPTNTYFSLGSSTACKVSPLISVSMWVYKDSWSGTYVPIGCTLNGGFNFLATTSTNKLEWLIYNNGAYTRVSSINYLSNITSGWHHLCGTYDGTTSKFYIDGELQGLANTTGTFTYNTSNSIFIGAEAGADTTTPTGSYLNGKLSDVRIYATALSADDVLKLYKLGNV